MAPITPRITPVARLVETPALVAGIKFPAGPAETVVSIQPAVARRPEPFDDVVAEANRLSLNEHGTVSYTVQQAGDLGYFLTKAGIQAKDGVSNLVLGMPEVHQKFDQPAPGLAALVGNNLLVRFGKDGIGRFDGINSPE